MAVYTDVTAEDLADFLSEYDLGALLSYKGIAEGVENSNYHVVTESGRYILTLYEKRVDPVDLEPLTGGGHGRQACAAGNELLHNGHGSSPFKLTGAFELKTNRRAESGPAFVATTTRLVAET